MGPMPWGDYRKLVEDLTFMVQAINPRAIVLVGGFNWGYDLSQVRYDPVKATNVAYVTHPYPQKRRDNWEAIIAFFEKRGISWTPWVFDVEWTSNLLDDWSYTPSRQGRFFREKMRELNK